MASAVDFSQLNAPVGPIIGGPIDAITAAIQRQQDEEEKKRLLQMQLDQRDRSVARLSAADENKNAYYQRKLDQADKRENARLTIENQKRQDATEDQIRAAVGVGDLAHAQQLAQRYQQVDPVTNEVASGLPGFELRKHGGQAEPQAPDPVTAMMTRLPFGVESAPDPEAAAGYKTAHDSWEGAPDIVALHGQPLDQDQIRHASGRAAAQDFQGAGDYWQAVYEKAVGAGDQQTAAAAKRKLDLHGGLVPLVASGQLTPEKASQMLMAGDADQRARDLAAGHDATALERTKLQDQAGIERTRIQGAAGIDRVRAGAETKAATQTSGSDPKAYARVQADYDKFDKRWNISRDRAEESRLATLLQNKDAQVVQRAIAGNLARGIGAEKGVLTDKDVERLQGHLGGTWGDIENWLEGRVSGDIGPDKKAALIQALQITLEEKARDREAAKAAFPKVFMRQGYPGQKWGFADDISNRYEEMFGEPYAAPAAAGRPQRDPSNPDDPNAPDAGRPLDGDVGDNRAGGIDRATLLQEAKRRGLVP